MVFISQYSHFKSLILNVLYPNISISKPDIDSLGPFNSISNLLQLKMYSLKLGYWISLPWPHISKEVPIFPF